MTSAWREERNAVAFARLRKSLPDIFPPVVLQHALRRPFIPPTPRLAVDAYWREHPLRADRLARALAGRSGTPAGWRWQIGTLKEGLPPSFRVPPSPFREPGAARPGTCRVCGQPVFRLGWHRDLWGDDAPNRNASWHTGCVIAWKLWNSPREFLKPLRRRQGRLCPATGSRLLRAAEVDHRVPLHQVWRDRRDESWPALLAYWGAPNLQVINTVGHREKNRVETADRAARRRLAPALALGAAPG